MLHSLPGYLGPRELLLQPSFLPEEQDFQGMGGEGEGQVPPGGRSASSAQWRGIGATWASPEPAAVHLALTPQRLRRGNSDTFLLNASEDGLHFPHEQVQAPLEVFPLYDLITICSNQITYYPHFTDENLKKAPKEGKRLPCTGT